MRQYIVIGHDAAITTDFTLNDLPGSAGRLDVLCRCINAAFMLSHGLRGNTRLHLVLQDRYTLRLEGSELQYLNPDERSTAALIKKALEKAQVVDVTEETICTPGIYIQERSFNELLAAVDGTIITLHENGTPLPDLSVPENPVFVLSDHNEFTPEEQSLLEERSVKQVSIGPGIVHADHAITVTHNFLDTDGFTRY